MKWDNIVRHHYSLPPEATAALIRESELTDELTLMGLAGVEKITETGWSRWLPYVGLYIERKMGNMDGGIKELLEKL